MTVATRNVGHFFSVLRVLDLFLMRTNGSHHETPFCLLASLVPVNARCMQIDERCEKVHVLHHF